MIIEHLIANRLRIIARYEKGETLRSIAKSFDTIPVNIRAILVESGVGIRVRGRISTLFVSRSERDEAIRKMLLANTSIGQITEQLQVGEHTVYKVIRGLGIERKVGRPKKGTDAKQCPHCKIPKPRTAQYFPPHPNTKDGLQSWCRACKKAIDTPKSRERRRIWREKQKESKPNE